jgi:hypothetical protein
MAAPPKLAKRHIGPKAMQVKGYDFDFFFRGTLAPARRASDNPIATACLRLVTFFPELPLRNVPRLRSFIVSLTFDCAVASYLAMVISIAAGRMGHRVCVS